MVGTCGEHTLFGFQEHIIKMQKQKMQLPPQPPPPQAQQGPPQQPAQVQVQTPQPPQQQQSPQLTTVTAPRPGALLTGTTVANLQVARLVSSSLYIYCPKIPSLHLPKGFWVCFLNCGRECTCHSMCSEVEQLCRVGGLLPLLHELQRLNSDF